MSIRTPNLKSEYVQTLLLFLFALVFFSERYDTTAFSIFQGRDIRRTYDLLQGNLIWYGPDLSGGAHTPGPFFYWLLALPLSIFKTWHSLVWLNIVLMSAAAAVLWFVGSALGSSFTGFILYFLFLSSRYLAEQMNVFWNPSFLYFFQAAIIYLALKSPPKKNHLILLGLLMGLTLQIHTMQLVFLGAWVGSFLLRDKWNHKKMKELLTFAAFTVLPLVPFFVWSLAQPPKAEAYSQFSGAASTILFPVIQIFNEPSDFFERISSNIAAFTSSDVVKEPFLLFLCWAWLVVLVTTTREKKVPVTNNRFLWMAWSLGLLICFPIIYDLHFRRYMEPFLLLCYILSVPHLEWLEKKHRVRFLVILAVNLCIFIWMFSPSFLLTKFSTIQPVLLSLGLTVAMHFAFRLTNRQRIALAPFWLLTLLCFVRTASFEGNRNAHDRELFLKEVIQKTGWSFKTFRERTFVAGVHREEEYEVIYEQILRTNLKPSSSDFDGILAVRRKAAKFLEGESPNWESIINLVPLEIYSAGASGDLICKETLTAGRFDVCFYKFKAPTAQFIWNNLGYPYTFRQPPLLPITEPTGAVRLGKFRWVFYKNNCASLEPSCTIYFVVESTGKKSLEVTVLGDPLGMPNPAPNPSWYLTIKNLGIEVACKKEVTSEILVTKLGIEMRPEGGFKSGFLAPFQTRVPINCEIPDKISVVVDEGFTGTINRGWQSAPFRLTWEAN